MRRAASCALIKFLHLEPAAIDQDEFSQAEWFWSTPPKVLSRSLSFLFFYLTVLVCLLYLVPDTIWFFILWILAGATCASIDHIRLNRRKMSTSQVLQGSLFICRNHNKALSIGCLWNGAPHATLPIGYQLDRYPTADEQHAGKLHLTGQTTRTIIHFGVE